MQTLRQPNTVHLKIIAAWLMLVWVVAAIDPFSRSDWLLENLLVFISVALLWITYPRFRFSTMSYWLFGVFMTLHLIGAHYTYAETPLGFKLQDWLDLERNHYDRIVHFAFGLLLAWGFREILEHYITASRAWINMLCLCIVLALSALYELVEMIAAMVVSPELGSAFLEPRETNGTPKRIPGWLFWGLVWRY